MKNNALIVEKNPRGPCKKNNKGGFVAGIISASRFADIRWNFRNSVHDVVSTHGIKMKILKFTKNIHKIKLTNGGRKLLETPNAGGNSVISEVLSFEVLAEYLFSVKLLYTEMELEYKCASKITDYSILVGKEPIGVSVTRMMKFKGIQHMRMRLD